MQFLMTSHMNFSMMMEGQILTGVIKNHPHPPDLGVKFLGSLSAESDLQLPEVELNSLNNEQKFVLELYNGYAFQFH